MNLIEFLREKLTPGVIGKVGGFLGESTENVDVALRAALPTMLGGLIQQGTTEEGANKIMDIIKDGGHTGDILSDLPTLLDNFDKTQLLVTIGTNIFNHFFGNTTLVLTDKIAGLSGIRKTSAASLLGFTAPLVLGTIGHVVNKENLGISGLMHLLDEQRDNVSKALPPTIAPHLPLRSITTTTAAVGEKKTITTVPPVPEKVVSSAESQRKENTDSFINKFFPWLLLVLLAIAVAYYLRSCKINNVGNDTGTVADSTESTNSSPNIMNDSSTFIEDGEDSLEDAEPVDETVIASSEEPEIVKVNPTVKGDGNVVANSRPTPQNTGSSTTARPNSSTSQDNRSNQQKTADANEPERAVGNPVTSQQLSSSNWTSVTSGNFVSNSAELRDQGSIKAIVTYLKGNPRSSVVIAPTGNKQLDEDRAYAVREQLIQGGISDSRISVAPSRSGSGVLVKVNR